MDGLLNRPPAQMVKLWMPLRALDRRGSLCAHPRSDTVPDLLRACSGPTVRGPGALLLDTEFSNKQEGKRREWDGDGAIRHGEMGCVLPTRPPPTNQH